MKLKRRPRAVIFDLDGTLLDTEPLYTEATQQVVGQFGARFEWELKARTMGGDAVQGAKLVIEELGIPLSVPDYLAQRAAILKRLFERPPVIPGAPQLVERLRAAALPLAVGTSSVKELCQIKRRSHAWLQEIEVFVCGDDPEVRARKPSPDIFLTAARRLNMPPQDCLVFEDSPAGVQAALNAGMQVIALPAPQLGPDAVAAADWVLTHYDEAQLSDLGLT